MQRNQSQNRVQDTTQPTSETSRCQVAVASHKGGSLVIRKHKPVPGRSLTLQLFRGSPRGPPASSLVPAVPTAFCFLASGAHLDSGISHIKGVWNGEPPSRQKLRKKRSLIDVHATRRQGVRKQIQGKCLLFVKRCCQSQVSSLLPLGERPETRGGRHLLQRQGRASEMTKQSCPSQSPPAQRKGEAESHRALAHHPPAAPKLAHKF